MNDQKKDKNEIKFEFNLKSTINSINKHGKITVRTATILAENLGEILKTYKKDLNFDQLVREAFKLKGIIKPSEYLGRFRIYKEKNYDIRTYERLAKDPKKYLLLTKKIALMLNLNEKDLISKLVQKTKFENPNIGDDNEFYDFEPIEKINQIIKATVSNIIKENNVEEYFRLKELNNIEMLWDSSKLSENKYILNKDNDHSNLLSIIPIYEKLMHCVPFCYSQDLNSSKQISNNFIFWGERISLSIRAKKEKIFKNNSAKNKYIFNPEIIRQPFYFIPGHTNKKNEDTPSFYFFNLGSTNNFCDKIIKDKNGPKVKKIKESNLSTNLIKYSSDQRKLSFNKDELVTFNKYGQKVPSNSHIFYFQNDYSDILFPFSNHFEAIIDSKIKKKEYINFEPTFFEIDSSEWLHILKNESQIFSRPGLAFSKFFSMDMETFLASQVREYKEKKSEDSVYSQLLSSILKLGPSQDRNYFYEFFEYLRYFTEKDKKNYHDKLSIDKNKKNRDYGSTSSALLLKKESKNLKFGNYYDVYPLNNDHSIATKPSFYEELDTGILNLLDMLELDVKRRVQNLKKILYEEKSFLNIKLDKELKFQNKRNKKIIENDKR